MKKNKIRLSESQLHNVIKESVNKILNELDWRTYATAAMKAKNTNDNRYDKFLKASDDAFNSESKYKTRPIKGDYQYSITKNGNNLESNHEHEYFDWHGNRKRFGFNSKKDYSIPNSDWETDTYVKMIDNGHNPDEYVEDEFHSNKAPYDRVDYTNPYGHVEALQNAYRMKSADKDMMDFYNGKSKYIKGKGWN